MNNETTTNNHSFEINFGAAIVIVALFVTAVDLTNIISNNITKRKFIKEFKEGLDSVKIFEENPKETKKKRWLL